MSYWKHYALNAILLIIVGYSILPDFSLNKNDFEKVSGLLKSARIETLDEKRPKKLLFNNIIRERLIIMIADRDYHEYYISDIYKKHWSVFLDYNTSGKEIVLYLGKGKQEEDPFRVELDGDVVFDTDIRFYRNLAIILFTLALSLFNAYHYFNLDKTKPVQMMKLKMIGLKHYFLD